MIAFLFQIPRQSESSPKSLRDRILELDLIGASILIPAIICLLLALQWGGSTYAWNNSRIIGLFFGFGCLIILFIFTQIKLGDRATLPPRILRQRSVAAASFFAFLFGAGFFILIFYLPVYFQSVKGVSATKSGIDVLPLMLATVISSILSGALITFSGSYAPLLISCTALYSIGAGLLTTYQVDMSFGKWFGYQVLAGAGLGAGLQIPSIAVQTALLADDVSIGVTCVMFFQTFGGALFVSVGQTVFQNGLIRGVHEFVPEIDPRVFLLTGATTIRDVLGGLGMLDKLQLVLEAYMVGLKDAFRVAVACACAAFLATLCLEWRNVKDEEVKRKNMAMETGSVM